LKDLGVDGRIILAWILNKYGERTWTGLVWLGYRPVVGSCEYCNTSLLSVSIKGGEFIDCLSSYQLLKEDSVPWSS
jgi:hypothetical protein